MAGEVVPIKKKKQCPACKKHKATIYKLKKVLKQIMDEASDTPILMGFIIDLVKQGLKVKNNS